MKTALTLLSVLIALPLSAWGSDFLKRVNETYQQTDRNFDLECRYSWNTSYKVITPTGETHRDSTSISRDFILETGEASIPMNFRVVRDGRGANYEALIDSMFTTRGRISNREFYLNNINDQNISEKFETSQIYCYVNFAYSLPFTLNDGDYHISVHPQSNYDWQSRLKAGIEKLLNNESVHSVIFLENGNERGELISFRDFFDGREPNLPLYEFESELVNVPSTTPLVVSPSGNSRFDVIAKDHINITFTGGNHNYCMWNVTRHVLQNFLNSSTNARLSLHYNMSLIVAQAQGMEELRLDFPNRDINRSNLLKDLLYSPAKQADYHSSYMQFFAGLLAREYQGMYKTYTVHYSAPGFKKDVILNGSGKRELQVDFLYE